MGGMEGRGKRGGKLGIYLKTRLLNNTAAIHLKKRRFLGGRGSSVGRARDLWSGGTGFDSLCGRPLPTGWVGVSIM